MVHYCVFWKTCSHSPPIFQTWLCSSRVGFCSMVHEVRCIAGGDEIKLFKGRQMLFRCNYTQSAYRQHDISVKSISSGRGAVCVHLHP